MNKIEDIEGIGPAYAEKLIAANIKTVEDILRIGARKEGRNLISEKTGISKVLILNWVNRADLTRIKGVRTQYADLLEAAGVDTVPELGQRNAENLTLQLKEVNKRRNMVRRVPNPGDVENWIKQAKDLPRVVEY